MNLPNIAAHEVAAVKAELTTDPASVGYPTFPATGTDQEKHAWGVSAVGPLCTRPQVANDPAPKVPAPLDAGALLGVLTPGAVRAIPMEGFDLVHQAIDAEDRPRLKRLLQIVNTKSHIQQAEYDALVAAVDAEVDAPDWPSTKAGTNRLDAAVGRTVGGISPIELIAIMES